jgi:hypothetical protein
MMLPTLWRPGQWGAPPVDYAMARGDPLITEQELLDAIREMKRLIAGQDRPGQA